MGSLTPDSLTPLTPSFRLPSLTLNCLPVGRDLKATDIQALITDYDYMPESALLLSAHMLYGEPVQLGPQLIGRLLTAESESVQELLNQVRRLESGFWLEPLRPSVTEAGGPLLQSLPDILSSGSRLTTLALTRDSKRAVSGGGGDGTLKVWDLDSAEQLHVIKTHSGGVSGLALSEDGKRAVSGGRDGALKVWDLDSGEQLHAMQAHSGGTYGGVEVLALWGQDRL